MGPFSGPEIKFVAKLQYIPQSLAVYMHCTVQCGVCCVGKGPNLPGPFRGDQKFLPIFSLGMYQQAMVNNTLSEKANTGHCDVDF